MSDNGDNCECCLTVVQVAGNGTPPTPPCTTTSGTLSEIQALRAAGSLVPNCIYRITGHNQGCLQGAEVFLRAIAANRFSMDADVVSSFDAVNSWRGLFDIAQGKLIKLEDNKGNWAGGNDGVQVDQFPWGVATWSENFVHGHNLTVPCTTTLNVRGNQFFGGFTDLTGATGSFTSNFVHNPFVTLTNSNLSVGGNLLTTGATLISTNTPGLVDVDSTHLQQASRLSIGDAGGVVKNSTIGATSNWAIDRDEVNNSLFFNSDVTSPQTLSQRMTFNGVISVASDFTISEQPTQVGVPLGELNFADASFFSGSIVSHSHIDTVTVTDHMQWGNATVRLINRESIGPALGPTTLRANTVAMNSFFFVAGATTADGNLLANSGVVQTAQCTFNRNTIGSGFQLGASLTNFQDLFLWHNSVFTTGLPNVDKVWNEPHQQTLVN